MDTSDATCNLAGEYLTFDLGSEAYGLDILYVQEIRSYEQPSHINGAPPFFKGVINLRGVIIPIFDLRIVAGRVCLYNAFTVVIVVNIGGGIIGAVVDGVSDVKNITPDQVCQVDGYPHPDTLMHVVAMANIDECRVALVDIEGLMASLHQSISSKRDVAM